MPSPQIREMALGTSRRRSVDRSSRPCVQLATIDSLVQGGQHMATSQRLMTADELLRLPDDGCRHELVEGELRTMAPAGFEHGAIAVRVLASLYAHVRAARLGRV